MRSKILGLDIGSRTVKMALCQNGVMLNCATLDMPEGLMVDDRITDPEYMGDLIRSTMQAHGMRANKAALVISNEVCFLRELSLPRMTVSQLEKNLPYEFTSYIEGDLKDYVFDYQMVGDVDPESETMSLMAVSLNGELVEQMQAIVHRARMKLVRIAPNESAFQGIIRRGKGAVAESGEYCFLNLGYNATRMFMFQKDRHTATRVLDNSLRTLETALMADMGVERDLASKYILENITNCHEREACLEIYRAIAVELMRALNFYRFSNPNSTLGDIWVCGGGAMIRPLAETIGSMLGVTLHSADELVPGGEQVKECNNYAQAIGIAMS